MFDLDIQKIKEIMSSHELTYKAMSLGEQVHRNQHRESGEKFIEHPLKVAALYYKISNGDQKGSAVAMLHDTIEQSQITSRELKKYFGSNGIDIVFLVQSLSKKPLTLFPSRTEQLAEFYGRFFPVSLIDRRVSLIKLLDRYHNIVTLDALAPQRAFRILEETCRVWIPYFEFLELPFTRELSNVCREKLAGMRFQTTNQQVTFLNQKSKSRN